MTPLYQEKVGPDGANLLTRLAEVAPETEFRSPVLEWLGRHYRPEVDLATAFATVIGFHFGSSSGSSFSCALAERAFNRREGL